MLSPERRETIARQLREDRERAERETAEGGKEANPPANTQEFTLDEQDYAGSNGHVYIPESASERKRLWQGRVTRLAWEVLRADPEYHKANLTVEDIMQPLRTEVFATVDSSRYNSAYAAFKPPPEFDEDATWALIGLAIEAAWENFRTSDRNALILRMQPKPPAPLPQRGNHVMRIKPEKVQWLWPGYLPIGKLCDVQGDPGQGKSAITTSLVATVSSGGTWPTGESCEAAGVIMISGEDDLADTIVPRLLAAGADRARIYAFTLHDELLFELPRDFDILREKCREFGVRLITIDPLDCFVTDDIEMNKNQSVRRLLVALAHFAAEMGVAVIVVRHLNKDSKTKSPMYRAAGSIGLNAASRQVFMVGASPDDKDLHVLAHVKGNCAPAPPSLGYRLEGVDLTHYPGISTVRVRWIGEVPIEAWQLLMDPLERTKKESQGAKLKEVQDALREILASGEERPSKEVEAQVRERVGDVSHGTIFNAKELIKVKARKRGVTGPWLWSLPADSSQESNDIDSSKI